MTTFEAKKVLVIDDETDLLNVFTTWLSDEGFPVDSYDDPEVALLDFKPNYYDIVITDVRMPKINGFEVARRILQQDPKTPICFVTPLDAIDEMVKIFSPENENIGFLKEPFPKSKFIDYVQEHARKK